MEILPWYLLATFGLPAFGAVLLLVSGLIAAAIFFRRRQGHAVEADYPKVLAGIGAGLVLIPSLYFSIVLNGVASGAGQP